LSIFFFFDFIWILSHLNFGWITIIIIIIIIIMMMMIIIIND